LKTDPSCRHPSLNNKKGGEKGGVRKVYHRPLKKRLQEEGRTSAQKQKEAPRGKGKRFPSQGGESEHRKLPQTTRFSTYSIGKKIRGRFAPKKGGARRGENSNENAFQGTQEGVPAGSKNHNIIKKRPKETSERSYTPSKKKTAQVKSARGSKQTLKGKRGGPTCGHGGKRGSFQQAYCWTHSRGKRESHQTQCAPRR